MGSSSAAVHTQRCERGSSVTQRQTNEPPALWPSAPGSRPARDENLEAVADADHRLAGGDEGGERIAQIRREIERPQAPGAECVGVGEPAGDAQQAGLGEALGLFAELADVGDDRLGAGAVERVGRVGIAVRSGRGEHERDGPAHRGAPKNAVGEPGPAESDGFVDAQRPVVGDMTDDRVLADRAR